MATGQGFTRIKVNPSHIANPLDLELDVSPGLRHQAAQVGRPAEVILQFPRKLAREDIRGFGEKAGREQIRALVAQYYASQEHRKRVNHQRGQMVSEGEPNLVLEWGSKAMESIEQSFHAAMDAYTDSDPLGRWAKSITGIGPVLAAGLTTYIDVVTPDPDSPDGRPRQRTAGSVWRYAGLDPTTRWIGAEESAKLVGQVFAPRDEITLDKLPDLSVLTNRTVNQLARYARGFKADPTGDDGYTSLKMTRANLIKGLSRRPWNAGFKALCWKIGESFVYQSGRDTDVYGKLIRERKAYEQAKNERGEYAEQAARKLANFRIGENTAAHEAYSQGKLPAGHIQERCKRWAVKLFLSHAHHVAWEIQYGEAPVVPYVFSTPGQHIDYMPPPNWPMS